MHKINSASPSALLQKYVRAYAQRDTDIWGTAFVARVPARLEQVLEFQFAGCFDVQFDDGYCFTVPKIGLIGPQTQLRASVSLCGRISSFGVFFQPAGFSQIFGVPMNLLADEGMEGASILGRRITSVWNELGECASFQQRVSTIERFLLRTVKSGGVQQDMMETCNRLLALQGRIPIAELAREKGMSLRELERKFMKHVGVAPKLYARIARFQTALDMKVVSPWMTWLEISHALGYFDQMHMIHDFKVLGGCSPNRLLGHLGDMRPEALASSFLDDARSSRIFTMRRSKEGRILPAS